MKTNEKYFFIIVITLLLSLFNTNISFFATDVAPQTISEVSFEKDILKKDKDDKITISSSLSLIGFHIRFKNHLYLKVYYSYSDTNQLLRPPIFT